MRAAGMWRSSIRDSVERGCSAREETDLSLRCGKEGLTHTVCVSVWEIIEWLA